MKTKDIVREIMIVNKLSQDNLAKILNISQKTVSNWLSGNDMPKASSILAIYDKFGITPNELLGLEEPKNFNKL